MTNPITPASPHKNFEEIKKINKYGIEYWEARELMPLLGYGRWENFHKVIDKAKNASENSGQAISNHFLDATKMIKIAKGTAKEAPRQVQDYHLSRYACYLIAQNGDPRKKQISIAQTYFAVQTRRQEVMHQLDEAQKRLMIRDEVKTENKKLFQTAQQAGVNNFGAFNNAGYLGLYGISAKQIQEKKKLGKDSILDRAGSTELAANLFRITQTDEKINRDEVKGQTKAEDTHCNVGKKVRSTIKEIGGTMPEELPPAEHIKKLKKREREEIKGAQNLKK